MARPALASPLRRIHREAGTGGLRQCTPPGREGGGVMLRAAIVVILLGVVLVMPAGQVRAAEWCDTDPLVLVRTPAGYLVPVYILVGAQGLQHLATVQAASLLVAADSDATMGGRA